MRITMSGRIVPVATMAAAALTLTTAAPAIAGPPDRADHGHILVIGIETQPGIFPPLPITARACIDLAGSQAVPNVAHEAHLHTGFDGGEFRARTGNIVIPTWPYEAQGQTVPWHNCDDFMAMFGLG